MDFKSVLKVMNKDENIYPLSEFNVVYGPITYTEYELGEVKFGIFGEMHHDEPDNKYWYMMKTFCMIFILKLIISIKT
jgi:hypothetical protein